MTPPQFGAVSLAVFPWTEIPFMGRELQARLLEISAQRCDHSPGWTSLQVEGVSSGVRGAVRRVARIVTRLFLSSIRAGFLSRDAVPRVSKTDRVEKGKNGPLGARAARLECAAREAVDRLLVGIATTAAVKGRQPPFSGRGLWKAAADGERPRVLPHRDGTGRPAGWRRRPEEGVLRNVRDAVRRRCGSVRRCGTA